MLKKIYVIKVVTEKGVYKGRKPSIDASEVRELKKRTGCICNCKRVRNWSCICLSCIGGLIIRILIGCVIGFYVSELNLIPEIINFTNEVGLTDYFIDSLEGMKEND